MKANNELKELQAREEKEIERILAELSAECAQFKDDITQDYDLLILLDAIFARAKLSCRMRACAAQLVGAQACTCGKPATPCWTRTGRWPTT
ncbi:MAG: hypothetical protein ACLRWQ_21620 [Flavonifractor plautii]